MIRNKITGDYEYGVPVDGDDVLIPCEWTVVLNVAEVRFGTLIIDGILKIDDSLPETTIYADNIWVRGGKLMAGTKTVRYEQQLNIILTGGRFGAPIVIDDISDTGTKTLAVTGKLDLYGLVPATTQTRLRNSADPGDEVIVVTGNIGSWKVDDEISLGGSNLDGTGFEKRRITAISGNSLTLDVALEFFHYGSN